MAQPSAAQTNMAARTDSELVEATRSGDLHAFGILVQRYQRRIFRIAVHLLKDAAEAEDVTQETFVRAYGALERFDGRCQPYTWMYRIAVNLSLNVIRARKIRRHTTPDDDPRIEGFMATAAPSGADPGILNLDRQMAQTLCDGIDDLSDTLRTTLVLVTVDGLSHAEASEVLGCPEGTIAWRVHEARRKLRDYMVERGFAETVGEGT